MGLRARKPRESPLVWVAFAAILLIYILGTTRTKPVASFGTIEYDGIYFTSAKAIASGEGYTLPEFPGHLQSMRYPKLYPLILAGIWKLDPHFPGNVAYAVGLNVGFGCLALLAIFLMLRNWPGLGAPQALAIVGLFAFSGYFLYLSATLIVGVPFIALMLWAAWFAERSLAREPGKWAAAGSGALAGMSVGLRLMGIPIVAGIAILLLFCREFRRLVWFCLPALPLTLLWSWPKLEGFARIWAPAAPVDPTRSGWTQTVCFYGSYASCWQMSLPNLDALKTTILLNLRFVAQEPGILLLEPLGTNGTVLSLVLVMLVSAAAYVGVVRSQREAGWRPLHAILAAYLLVFLFYPFNPGRYLLPLAPLLVAGLWLSVEHVVKIIGARWHQGCGKDERVAAWILGILTAALVGTIAVNLCYAMPRKIEQLGKKHAAVLADEQGAFAWIRQHANPKAKIISYEEGLTYLATGRPAIRAIYCVSEASYLQGPRVLQHDFARMTDVAKHIHASYWLTTPYDFPMQGSSDRIPFRQKANELLAAAPILYHSKDGRVTLYDIRCLTGVDPAACGGKKMTKAGRRNHPPGTRQSHDGMQPSHRKWGNLQGNRKQRRTAAVSRSIYHRRGG